MSNLFVQIILIFVFTFVDVKKTNGQIKNYKYLDDLINSLIFLKFNNKGLGANAVKFFLSPHLVEEWEEVNRFLTKRKSICLGMSDDFIFHFMV